MPRSRILPVKHKSAWPTAQAEHAPQPLLTVGTTRSPACRERTPGTDAQHAPDRLVADDQEVVSGGQAARPADAMRHHMAVGAAHADAQDLHEDVIVNAKRRFRKIGNPGPASARTSHNRAHHFSMTTAPPAEQAAPPPSRGVPSERSEAGGMMGCG